MSAIGPSTAVVSLGCSCQTAWQVKQHAGLLSTLLGETLVASSLPYDWLIMPPDALTSWLASGECFPAASSEIVQHPNFGWPRHGLHFWHEFQQDGAPALQQTFDAASQKFAHLFGKLAALRKHRRRVFVMSNTQNNLDTVRGVAPWLDFTFTAARLNAVVASVERLFPGGNRFLFAAYASRIGADVHDIAHPVEIFEPDGSDVFGDGDRWAALFRDALAPMGHQVGRAA